MYLPKVLDGLGDFLFARRDLLLGIIGVPRAFTFVPQEAVCLSFDAGVFRFPLLPGQRVKLVLDRRYRVVVDRFVLLHLTAGS